MTDLNSKISIIIDESFINKSYIPETMELYVEHLLDGIEEIEISKYPDKLFYIKNDKVQFSINKIDRKIQCSLRFLKFVADQYTKGISRNDIKYVLHEQLSKKLNIGLGEVERMQIHDMVVFHVEMYYAYNKGYPIAFRIDENVEINILNKY